MRRRDYPTYLIHYGVKGQRWGVRNGPPYPLDSSKLASKIYRDAKRNEPGISRDVFRAVSLTDGKMYGLEHKLKSRKSIERKIRTDSIEKGVSESKAASSIKDSVRYTVVSKDKSFTSNYEKIKSSLENNNYREVRCRNYWSLYKQGLAKHKSVQSVFESPNGYIFEIQFQTPSSQSAKDRKTPLYEEARRVETSRSRKRELERQMDELAKTVKTPSRIYLIKNH